jgi:hypothetical protein
MADTGPFLPMPPGLGQIPEPPDGSKTCVCGRPLKWWQVKATVPGTMGMFKIHYNCSVLLKDKTLWYQQIAEQTRPHTR